MALGPVLSFLAGVGLVLGRPESQEWKVVSGTPASTLLNSPSPGRLSERIWAVFFLRLPRHPTQTQYSQAHVLGDVLVIVMIWYLRSIIRSAAMGSAGLKIQNNQLWKKIS